MKLATPTTSEARIRPPQRGRCAIALLVVAPVLACAAAESTESAPAARTGLDRTVLPIAEPAYPASSSMRATPRLRRASRSRRPRGPRTS